MYHIVYILCLIEEFLLSYIVSRDKCIVLKKSSLFCVSESKHTVQSPALFIEPV